MRWVWGIIGLAALAKLVIESIIQIERRPELVLGLLAVAAVAAGISYAARPRRTRPEAMRRTPPRADGRPIPLVIDQDTKGRHRCR